MVEATLRGKKLKPIIFFWPFIKYYAEELFKLVNILFFDGLNYTIQKKQIKNLKFLLPLPPWSLAANKGRKVLKEK